MNTFNPGGEPQKAVEADRRALKVNKACVPCRARKIKCDAAVVGLPCSSCKSRQCVEDCVPLVRKGRTRKGIHVSSTPGKHTGSPAIPDHPQSDFNPDLYPTLNRRDCQSPDETESDLFYLRILNDAVEETPGSSGPDTRSTIPRRPKLKESIFPQNSLSTELSHLDEIDREYLAKKGCFDLPPPQYLNVLVKTYLDHVDPFCPVISRVDFARCYQSGDCSLLLLRVILTTASVHAPADVLSACGFDSRSAAQESFFSKARLLYDFTAGDNPLLLLQASTLLCRVIFDHPTDRDFGYWLHNAISFATKLNLRDKLNDKHVRELESRKGLILYRRIWRVLYTLDVFHVFINIRRSRLLENTSDIKVSMEDEWEDEDIPGELSGLLSAVTPQQKASPAVLCELSQIFGECLSVVKSQRQQDPRQMLRPLDAWRDSLASRMHVDGDSGTNTCYLNAQALSYRFECILCRLIRRTWQRSRHVDWSEWAKRRLRSAILELDTIAMRVLASVALEELPMPFLTTIAALLALHIESALDPTETDLIRSMSRISISQTMLILTQGKEIPAFKRALPIFEETLAKSNLYLVPPNGLDQSNHQLPTEPRAEDNNITDAYASPHAQFSGDLPQQEHWAINPLLDMNFLGGDFLDEWQQIGQPDFSG